MVQTRLMRRGVIGLVVVAALGGGGWLLARHLLAPPGPTLLYGNVEIRQVDLGFNVMGTVQTMAKREGDAVRSGELLAELDPDTLRSAVALAQARRDAAAAQLDQLLHGTRPEQIQQAESNLALAQATLAHAEFTFNRQRALAATSVASQQQLDDARMSLDSARARVGQTGAALLEARNGPRVEEIAASRAQLRSAEATLQLANIQLGHTRVTAPADGTIMTRVVEPGTVVLPASTVYSMAITGETWVRGFVPEPLLARVAPGSEVAVLTDGRPDRPYRGRVGYVSPSAEFTPKTVETPELRTQLVYRLRIRVEDADDGIRQGQPVTIRLPN